jgi:hypothetical protein
MAAKKRQVNLESMARAHTETAIRTIAGVMNNKKAGNGDRLRAAEILMDRGWGKAASTLEITGKNKGPIELAALSPHEIARREAAGLQHLKNTLDQIGQVIEHEEIIVNPQETSDAKEENVTGNG